MIVKLNTECRIRARFSKCQESEGILRSLDKFASMFFLKLSNVLSIYDQISEVKLKGQSCALQFAMQLKKMHFHNFSSFDLTQPQISTLSDAYFHQNLTGQVESGQFHQRFILFTISDLIGKKSLIFRHNSIIYCHGFRKLLTCILLITYNFL